MKNSIYITHLQNIILWKALCYLFLFLQKQDVWQFILGVDSLSALYIYLVNVNSPYLCI